MSSMVTFDIDFFFGLTYYVFHLTKTVGSVSTLYLQLV